MDHHSYKERFSLQNDFYSDVVLPLYPVTAYKIRHFCLFVLLQDLLLLWRLLSLSATYKERHLSVPSDTLF